jgi:cytochrome P450 PksS
MSADRPTLTDPAVLIDPYPTFAWLRENDPVHWSDEVRAWIVTRHADVSAAFRDPRLSADRVKVLVHFALAGGDPTPVREYLRITGDMMLMKDGPEHHRLRVLGNRGFTPSALASWAPRVDKVVNELLGRVGPDGRFDLVADLAEPMPASVIAEMFGIPRCDHHLFRKWADDLARFFGGTMQDPATDALKANDAALEFERYFLRLHDERKRQPSDDLMSLFQAAEEAGRLSAAEVVAQCQLILVAGHVTTIDQLANGVYAILRHEGTWERLATSPELVKSAVEEMIRFDPSVTLVMRVATEDMTLHGKQIKAGQLLLLALAAANRDPVAFSDPDKFDVARSPNKHLGFGVGHHQCLGMNLARLELEASLRGLLKRFPRLTLDRERLPVRKVDSLTFRGFARLPVRAC